MRLIKSIAAIALVALAGCATWETSYTNSVPTETSNGWKLNAVDFQVPSELSVSEANNYAPDADIVWQDEVLMPGETRQGQVDEIMTEAIRRGASTLPGSRPVNIQAELASFHTLTNFARYRLPFEGINNIAFTMQVTDARSGEVLVPSTLVRADFPALVGGGYQEALSRGETPEARITSHVAATVAGMLGQGPDNRFSVSQVGR